MATTQTQKLPTAVWRLDPVHSSVRFAVAHNGVSLFRSGFGEFDAQIVGGDAPWLDGSVKVSSIEVGEEQLRGHLLSPEFFDAERHPELRFHSTALRIGEDGEAQVRGELEIRGELREVEASGRVSGLGADAARSERIGVSLEATVDRRDFGLDWNAELPGGGPVLDYEVSISVDLELVWKEA